MFVEIEGKEYIVNFRYDKLLGLINQTTASISLVTEKKVEDGKLVGVTYDVLATGVAECQEGDTFIKAVGREIALDLCLRDLRNRKIFTKKTAHQLKVAVFSKVRHSTKEQRELHLN